MTLRHPFQKLCCVQPGRNGHHIILAATGPVICSISIEDGELLSRWPLDGTEEFSDMDELRKESPEYGERPSKRRKVESTESELLLAHPSDGSDESLEIVAERKKGERRRPKPVDSKLSNVSHVLATQDGKHVVAVTADDKSVKVFELKGSGRLQVLSERSLPKRLCALRLTTDETTILAADKFGDVYSLPLHPSKDYVPNSALSSTKTIFSPAATELTVHTKGNREALRQQLEQKKIHTRKEGPDFEHRLLLGHVSLLTDLAVAEGEVAEGEVAEGEVTGRMRPYILTADRDEHIRVSRGIPQTHIIERYCLGHKEFVSKLCIPPWASDVLIAGNGEPSLRTFKWQIGEQIQELNFLQTIPEELKQNLRVEGRDPEKLAVSGIWPVVNSKDVELVSKRGDFLVALEGLPILLNYSITNENQLVRLNDVSLKANVLDVTQIGNGRILVSIDSVHRSASMKMFRPEDEAIVPPLQAFEYVAGPERSANGASENGMVMSWNEFALSEVHQMHEFLTEIESCKGEARSKGRGHEASYSNLGEFLYGLENLRKKRGAMAEEEAEEAEEAAELEAGDIALQELAAETSR